MSLNAERNRLVAALEHALLVLEGLVAVMPDDAGRAAAEKALLEGREALSTLPTREPVIVEVIRPDGSVESRIE